LTAAPEHFIGCAGWSLAREHWPDFPEQGTHLQRYAARFNSVEINSSFYRPHRPQTYIRWAESVPDGFRFSVKVPKQITHEQRLVACEALLDAFLDQCGGLGEKLGCLLVQLPPSLQLDVVVAEGFLKALRTRFEGAVVLEPRHESWQAAHQLLVDHRVARVAADPAPITDGNLPGGWEGVRYWRLHGSPRIYHSAYGRERLDAIAAAMRASAGEGVQGWCIFDNTASGAAVGDALLLDSMLSGVVREE
jgi:uncharacterized protein YecE (DUF72 family)